MSDLKWMPLDVRWMILETLRFDAMESGAYFLLVMAYWEMGRLPDDDRALARLTKLSPYRWKKIRPLIAEQFEMPGWRHQYLDNLRTKAQANYDRRVAYLKANDARRPPPSEWATIRRRIFERDNYICTYCGVRGGELHCDHVVPIARDGTNADDNLTTACANCNVSKGALLLSEWIQ